MKNLASPTQAGKKALLFLPEGEHYDLLLLYVFYVLKKRGIQVLYLGTNISQKNLISAIEQKRPDWLYSHQPVKKRFDLDHFSAFLSKQFPGLNLCLIETNREVLRLPYSNVFYLHYETLLHFKQDETLVPI